MEEHFAPPNLPVNMSYNYHHHVHNNGSDIILNDGDSYYSMPYVFIIQFQIVFLASVLVVGILGKKLYNRCFKYTLLTDQPAGMDSAEQLEYVP